MNETFEAFARALRDESRVTRTENGARAYDTTLNACVDFFGLVGALRNADEGRIIRLFDDAYKANPTYAMRIMFYGRDVRGGLGERRVFRILLNYVAHTYTEALRPYIKAIPEFGRFDDWYELIGTPLEEDMWEAMKYQLGEDCVNRLQNKPCSLLAKWVKTADASSPKTRALGIKTALNIGLSVRDYKMLVRALRKYLKVVEPLMSTNKWGEIDYESVPSKAMNNYRNAFSRHDVERFDEYLESVEKGETTIKADALYPYDIVQKVLGGERSRVLEAQWNALPNYVEGENSVLVMADTSGSMFGWGNSGRRPGATAIGLALYFAERNKGAYHGMFMTFSRRPQIQLVRGNNLYDKIHNLRDADWDGNTDLEAALEKILDVAVKNKIPRNEMVKSLVIVSDMEIDQCTNERQNFYLDMRDRYAAAGYDIPNIVFWNVESRHDIFHADANQAGVQLCSGQSTSVFKTLMGSIGLNAIEYMEKVLNGDRYKFITVS